MRVPNPFRRRRRTPVADRLPEIKKQVEEAKEAMETRHREWALYRSYYDGSGQAEGAGMGDMPEKLQSDFVQTNFCFSSLESYIAVLMQAMPVPYVVDPAGEQDVSSITPWLQAYDREHNVPGQREMAFRDTVPLGDGALKVYWDTRKNDVAVSCIAPETIHPDPAAHDLDTCSFVALRNVYSEALAKRLFPRINLAKAAKVTSDEVLVEIEEEPEKKGERVEIWEVYYNFGENLVIFTQDQELFRGPNPTPNNRYPIFMFQMHKRPGVFWGEGLIQHLIPLQDLINKTRTRIAVWQRYMVNPWYWGDSQDLDLDVTPGAYNTVIPGSEIHVVRPPPLPDDVNQMLVKAQQDFDAICGVQEILRGLRPKGTTSGISLEVLGQRAETRLTGPARNWTFVLRDIWQTVLEIMQQGYGEDRTLATIEGGLPTALQLPVQALSSVEWERNDEGEERPHVRSRGHRVVMQAGGELPMSPAANAQLAIQLKQLPNDRGGMGVIDDTLLLETLKLPGRHALRKRIAAQMEAEQAGQMQGVQMQQEQAQQQQGAEAAQAAEAQLQQMLSPEEMDLLRGIKQGTIDQGLAEEFMQSLAPDMQQLALIYLEVGAQAPAPAMGPM